MNRTDTSAEIRQAKARFGIVYFNELAALQHSQQTGLRGKRQFGHLVEKYSAAFAEKYRMPAVSFDDNAQRALMHYSWPGNVRQ